MIESFFIATIVGVVEIAPGVCQMDLLNPDLTINTSQVGCEYIVPNYEPLHASND